MGPVDITTTTSTGQNYHLAGTSLPQRGKPREPLQYPASPRDVPGAQTDAGRRGLSHGPAAVPPGRSRRRVAASVKRLGREAAWGQPASRGSGKARHSPGGGRGSSQHRSHRVGGGGGGEKGARHGGGLSAAPPRCAERRRNTVRAGRTPEAAPSHRPAALNPAGGEGKRGGKEKGRARLSGLRRNRGKGTRGLRARPHLRRRRGPHQRPNSCC